MFVDLGNFGALRTFRVLRALKTVAVVPGMYDPSLFTSLRPNQIKSLLYTSYLPSYKFKNFGHVKQGINLELPNLPFLI